MFIYISCRKVEKSNSDILQCEITQKSKKICVNASLVCCIARVISYPAEPFESVYFTSCITILNVHNESFTFE